MTVRLPAEQLSASVSTRLKELRAKFKLPGFRPGKVPMQLVQSRYGDQVRQEMTAELVESSFRDALAEKALTPAGAPSVELLEKTDEQADGDFAYSATFEVFPEFALVDLSGVEFERLVCLSEEADIDEALERLRKERSIWDDKPGGADWGDRLELDYTMTIDGQDTPHSQADNTTIELVQDRPLTDLIAPMLGLEPGQDKTYSYVFDADYPDAELSGKSVQYYAKVHSVKVGRLPELDAEFVRQFGIESGDIAELRSQIGEQLKRETDRYTMQKLNQDVMQKLVDLHDIELPKALVDRECQRLIDPEGKGSAPQQEWDAKLLEDAKRNVKIGLIVMQVIETAKLKADAQSVRAHIDELAAPYKDREQVVNYYYSNQKALQEVENQVLEQTVINWVVAQGTVTDRTITRSELAAQ